MKGESVIREQADRARGLPLTPQDLAALLGRAGVTRLRQLAGLVNDHCDALLRG
jgi:hypothetical protein